jgi:hypothetical protein
MKETLQEPGFWLCIFAVIIMTILLYAPNARCEMLFSGLNIPHVTYEENSEQYGDYLYTVKIRTTCTTVFTGGDDQVLIEDVCDVAYLHFIGTSKDDQILTHVCDTMPTHLHIKLQLGLYMLMLEEGGI